MVGGWNANQPAQYAFMQNMWPGSSCYTGGWGSGKTYAGARKLLLLHQLNRCPGLAVGATYGDIWRTIVPALQDAAASVHWPCRVVRSEPRHLMVGRYPIWLLSAEAPERFAGFEVGHIWGDEAARFLTSEDPLRDSPTQIRSRLRHPAAKSLHALYTTTHEGTGTWIYRDWIGKPKAGHVIYKGRTALNAALDPSYVADRLATLPAALARQYLDGEAVDFATNLAHPGFNSAHEVAVEVDPSRPVHLGADFNVSPLCWILCQVTGSGVASRVHVVDELVIDDHATIEGAMHATHAKGWGKQMIHLHLDRSAKNRSTTSDPIASIMEQTARSLGWRYNMRAEGANPPINQRISLVDALIQPYQGPPRLTVHPRCSRLIQELKTVGRITSGAYDPGREGKRGHILDALGYACWDEAHPGAGVAALHY